jgi:type I restriction enzyme R subunit
VLFASAVVDYDYIMNLIAKYTQGTPKKQKMTRDQLIGVLSSSANLMEEREDIIDYIKTFGSWQSIKRA